MASELRKIEKHTKMFAYRKPEYKTEINICLFREQYAFIIFLHETTTFEGDVFNP